ncbi:beta-defensin 1 [Eulemur rufifrons]|uniref:beta-defensin 1 n=1 Tax=Eulemur rufifrons TaxID=859984 RepID=UPI00374235DB
MRTPCLLLLTLCLLFSQVAPGILLRRLIPKPDHYVCHKNGGICFYSLCPTYTKLIGTCYRKKAKCCK